MNVAESLTCGVALNVLQEATRRCDLHAGWPSSERQLANCLHLILFKNLPNLQVILGLSSHLVSNPFTTALGVSPDIGEKARRSAPAVDWGTGKKEVQKDNKGHIRESQASAAPPTSIEALVDWLRASHVAQQSTSAVARLLWLSPGAASAESIDLLRRSLATPCYSTSGPHEPGVPGSSRTTITSMTSRGHFSLPLGEQNFHLAQRAKGKASAPSQDLAVLVAIFTGTEVRLYILRIYGSNLPLCKNALCLDGGRTRKSTYRSHGHRTSWPSRTVYGRVTSS